MSGSKSDQLTEAEAATVAEIRKKWLELGFFSEEAEILDEVGDTFMFRRLVLGYEVRALIDRVKKAVFDAFRRVFDSDEDPKEVAESKANESLQWIFDRRASVSEDGRDLYYDSAFHSGRAKRLHSAIIDGDILGAIRFVIDGEARIAEAAKGARG